VFVSLEAVVMLAGQAYGVPEAYLSLSNSLKRCSAYPSHPPCKPIRDFKWIGGNKKALSFSQMLTLVIYKSMEHCEHTAPAVVRLKHSGLSLASVSMVFAARN